MVTVVWFSYTPSNEIEPSQTQVMIMNNRNTKHNQKTRLLTLLADGKEFSINEVSRRCQIANPSAVVAELRANGARIYTNERKTKDGRTVYKYRLATNS